jgi:Holliday junction DNA helicase RuvB
LETIITRAASILKIPIDPSGAAELSGRARGTPRIANRLLKRVRDYAEVRAEGVITESVANDALELLEVDHKGLDKIDCLLLRTIIQKFGGGPVGVETLAAATSEPVETIEDVYEPYLLQMGFLQRTPRGRTATSLAYQHLGITQKGSQGQSGLFEED